MTRVLMISKACLIGTYQRKLEEIATHDEIDLTVVVPSSWKDARGELRVERVYTKGYQLIDIPIRFNGNFHLHFYPKLRDLIHSIKPDLVHIDEEPYNFATYHALKLGRAFGARNLFFSWQNINRRYPPPFNWLERWVLNNIDYGIVGNNEALTVWQEKGYGGPLTLIPQFGVDPELFSPEVDNNPHDRPFTIGYAGRLVEGKRDCISLSRQR